MKFCDEAFFSMQMQFLNTEMFQKRELLTFVNIR